MTNSIQNMLYLYVHLVPEIFGAPGRSVHEKRVIVLKTAFAF